MNKKKIPRHVAIIMDGNGRWAERRKLPRKMGHAEGCKVLEQTVRDAADLGIDYLTVYAFSTETGSALRKRFRRLWFLWLLH